MHATRVLTKPEQAQSSDGTLNSDLLSTFQADFTANPANRQAQNAVTQVSIEDVALNHAVAIGITPSFSTVLDDWTVTNQKRTGRCWMFAGLNLLRVGAMKAMNLRDFEFSQNYTLFWDKVERANYFLEAIIETIDRRPLREPGEFLAAGGRRVGPADQGDPPGHFPPAGDRDQLELGPRQLALDAGGDRRGGVGEVLDLAADGRVGGEAQGEDPGHLGVVPQEVPLLVQACQE